MSNLQPDNLDLQTFLNIKLGDIYPGAAYALHMRTRGFDYNDIGEMQGITRSYAHELVKKTIMRIGHFVNDPDFEKIDKDYQEYIRAGVKKWGLWYPKVRGLGKLKLPGDMPHRRRGEEIPLKSNIDINLRG